MIVEFMEYKWIIKIIQNHAINIKDNTYSYGPFENLLWIFAIYTRSSIDLIYGF